MWSDAVRAQRADMMKFIRELKMHLRLKAIDASESSVQSVLEYARFGLEYLRFGDPVSAHNAFQNARGEARDAFGSFA
jgi:hypothetical protein